MFLQMYYSFTKSIPLCKHFAKMNNNLIELVRFGYEWQANIFAQILTEESIEHYTSETNALEPATGFVVYISAADEDRANELLQQFDSSDTITETESD